MRARLGGGVVAVVLVLAGCGPEGTESAESGADGQAAPGAGEQVECFDADYPGDPAFDTPEEALEHATENELDAVAVPDDLDEYERVERADGWLEFEFRAGEEIYHIWGITRDDGQWAMTSLGGCVPAGALS